MNVKYFKDTDTAFLSFSDDPVVATKEINENIYADFDKTGKVVSLTIEHASKSADLPKFAFEVVGV